MAETRVDGRWLLGVGADGGGVMMSCSAHPSRPLTRHRICSIAEGGKLSYGPTSADTRWFIRGFRLLRQQLYGIEKIHAARNEGNGFEYATYSLLKKKTENTVQHDVPYVH